MGGEVQVRTIFHILVATLILVVTASGSLFGQDYFKTYANPQGLPVKMYFIKVVPGKPDFRKTQLLRVDDTKGTIKLSEGDFLLRDLEKQNIKRFEYEFPRQTLENLKKLADEQYDDPKVLAAVRPVMYRVLPFHEINPEFFPIHDNCLIYVQALIAMEQYNEALSLLYKLNLKRLDDYEYREFSEAALDLAGKMIATNPKAAPHVRVLLAKVNIRNNGADHEASSQMLFNGFAVSQRSCFVN